MTYISVCNAGSASIRYGRRFHGCAISNQIGANDNRMVESPPVFGSPSVSEADNSDPHLYSGDVGKPEPRVLLISVSRGLEPLCFDHHCLAVEMTIDSLMTT